ncbi:putative nucleolar GTP-binding protein 2 [Monocercomonoides exilis]|uniref:putative nucleolar GTP-binding protein 2 n=1 Tax=Monocercomonoides exilis TaxID=2049356 RepID=UPI00355AA369|nr:putative nucleolar GTP-binding protein 2 [Monocercomonoides exilis]|eukprot:MONOS_5137.1-p1 / transcript=MONOS_5137.1 / gene=MONOS_5137 / organism=Monocercomonoides_exilis_PA203 / gene_product=nucleolar GTP-binding protein 2 / transcript_product=nucleolar GTP-binding protein 2 / location=Mono_scaffold00146:70623-73243(-) / protein_length=711 / sequence_SO=supercontig / SO=protein_coding / is_pseudo=false
MSSSDKADRRAPQHIGHARSQSTIKRVKMYRERPKRGKRGNLKSSNFHFQDSKPACGPKARLPPDKTLFGGSRFAPQAVLQKVRKDYEEAKNNPLSVVLSTPKFPMSLIQPGKTRRMHLLSADSFENTFGPKAQRKRPKLSFTLNEQDKSAEEESELPFMSVPKKDLQSSADEDDSISLFVKSAMTKQEKYDPEEDSNIIREMEFKDAVRHSMFDKGQSKRIWGELYKVIDASDVVAVVLDARDPFGTRAKHVEKYIKENCPHKHLFFIINKCDLVPTWAVRSYLFLLSKDFPTLAFHANINKPFGKDALFKLLSEFRLLHSDKKHISVGLIGYPNVGKSSVINTLRKKAVCRVAPIPGETKVWQYVALTNGIFLIDCPGIVPPDSSDDDTQLVLKGVVRVENLKDASSHIPMVMEKVKKQYIDALYGISDYSTPNEFLEKLAQKMGRLLKGGEPDIDSVAKVVLADFQRGKIPYFVSPFKERLAAMQKSEGEEEEGGEKEGLQTKAGAAAVGQAGDSASASVSSAKAAGAVKIKQGDAELSVLQAPSGKGAVKQEVEIPKQHLRHIKTALSFDEADAISPFKQAMGKLEEEEEDDDDDDEEEEEEEGKNDEGDVIDDNGQEMESNDVKIEGADQIKLEMDALLDNEIKLSGKENDAANNEKNAENDQNHSDREKGVSGAQKKRKTNEKKEQKHSINEMKKKKSNKGSKHV